MEDANLDYFVDEISDDVILIIPECADSLPMAPLKVPKGWCPFVLLDEQEEGWPPVPEIPSIEELKRKE